MADQPYRRHRLGASVVPGNLEEELDDIYRWLRTIKATADAAAPGTAPPTDHNLLGAEHADTTPASPVNGDVITAQAGAWARKAVGSNGQVLGVVSGAPTWTNDASGLNLPHDVLGAQHVDSVAASPVLGDIIEAQAADVSTAHFFFEGAPSAYFIDSLDVEANQLFFEGAPTVGLFAAQEVKWQRKAIGAAGTYLRSNGITSEWAGLDAGASAGASVYKAADLVLPDNTETLLTFDTEIIDQGEFWSSGSPGRFTVPTGNAGIYVFRAGAAWTSGFVGLTYIILKVNGVEKARQLTLGGGNVSTGHFGNGAVTLIVSLNPGDYVEAYVHQHANIAGTASAIEGGAENTFFQMGKLQASATALVGAELPSPVAGSMLKGNASATAFENIAIGSSGQVLVSDGSAPGWSSNVPLKDGTNAFTGANSFATNPLDLLVGQLKFPASQNASSDANTLDDYEEGTWTPELTFDTPGDLAVTYAVRQGSYTKIGQLVRVDFFYITSSFTHTTAAGNARLTGLPFAGSATFYHFGALQPNQNFGATITDFFARIDPGNSYVSFLGYTPGTGPAFLGVANMATGVQQSILGSIVYRV